LIQTHIILETFENFLLEPGLAPLGMYKLRELPLRIFNFKFESAAPIWGGQEAKEIILAN
jgi:hypothetical protein